MKRNCKAIITLQHGHGRALQLPVSTASVYQTEESVDNDADSFSITVQNVNGRLDDALDRDVEVRTNIFIDDIHSRLVPIFTGIGDTVTMGADFSLEVIGRDLPSSLAVDSDAIPGRWRNMQPRQFIQKRAHQLGIAKTQIAKLSQIHSIYTDGTEKEWAFWYRIARMKDMYMWTNHLSGGTLIIDKLGYSLAASYYFGDPPKGHARGSWQPVEDVQVTSTKNTRERRIIAYGENAKKGKPLVAQSVDTTIPNWRKKPTMVLTSTKAKTQAELKKEAGIEMFESIVGAVEYSFTVHDHGQLIQQNRMCRVNLPKYGLLGNYFIVGVSRSGGADGFTQTVRIRERGFALSKRVPDAPTLEKTKTATSDDYKPATSIAAALQKSGGVRWADSFVRATREFGVPAGWDFAVFLGVLLSICQQETGFANVRQTAGAYSHIEWMPFDQFADALATYGGNLFGDTPENPNIFGRNGVLQSLGSAHNAYNAVFANDGANGANPFHPDEAGVGAMQLTSTGYKGWADGFGWNGSAKNSELDGGRWNPDSNIRAAARALVEKGKANPPADPTNADDIWIAVQRYNGSGPKSEAYVRSVQALYKTRFGAAASAATALPKAIPPGSTNTNVNIPGHGVIALPDSTPETARKAIAFALSKLGDPYLWDGSGPLYDCSSFVTAALTSGSPALKATLDYPFPGHHGENTVTLFRRGRFGAVDKDKLLPADLVFFVGSDGTPDAPGHVGMYIGDNLFIQDPRTGESVKVSGLGEDYYVNTYVGARRLLTTIPIG